MSHTAACVIPTFIIAEVPHERGIVRHGHIGSRAAVTEKCDRSTLQPFLSQPHVFHPLTLRTLLQQVENNSNTH